MSNLRRLRDARIPSYKKLSFLPSIMTWSRPVALLVWGLFLAGCYEPRYNDVQQKGTHNAYTLRTGADFLDPNKAVSLFDQLVYHRIRSIELDLHRGEEPGTWTVWHENPPDWLDWLPWGGSHQQSETTCFQFEECLEILETFHRSIPDHEVVTVWLELKDAFMSAWNNEKRRWEQWVPNDIDVYLSRLGGSAIFTPANLLQENNCHIGPTDLQDVVSSCGWPRVSELRKKFIFVVFEGEESQAARVQEYAQKGRVAFTAPRITKDNEGDIESLRNIVFVYIDDIDHAKTISQRVLRAGKISRGYCKPLAPDLWDHYSSLNVEDELIGCWNRLKEAPVHHIFVDRINAQVSPWASTANTRGWPFRCLSGSCNSQEEASDIIGMEINTGDVRDAEKFFFAYRSVEESDVTWTAYVSTASGGVEDLAEGCLMSRQNPSEGSAYFAVCRPADKAPMRLMYQGIENGAQVESEVKELGGDPEKTPSFIRFHAKYSSDGITCFTAHTSPDGLTFGEEGPICLQGSFPLQGLAATSHGNQKVKILFGNVTKRVGAGTAETQHRTFVSRRLCDGCNMANQRIFDGVF